MAPLRRGLSWLGNRPPTARLRPRWVLPAAFLATVFVAGVGGYLLHGANGPAAKAAGSNAAPPGPGTGVSAPGGNQVLDAKAVFDRLAAAGLPVTNAVPIDTSTDPDKLLGHAGGYTSRLSFTVPGGNPKADQYGIGRGGVIEVFANAADAKRRADRLRKDRGSRDEHQYLAGSILVRLVGGVDRTLADKFRTAVAAVEKAAVPPAR
jgi:hypothetical protein